MNGSRTRVPIRIKRQKLERRGRPAAPVPVEEAVPPVVEADEGFLPPAPAESPAGDSPAEDEELEMWRDRALRLEAEIDNFRKRQRRIAEDRISADRERLLRAFLSVADDLDRALSDNGVDADSLRQGVHITQQSLMLLLGQEGVEAIQAEGQPFDPSWHEAVDTVPHQEAGVEAHTVVGVTQPGYRLGKQLLRPARVIVAT